MISTGYIHAQDDLWFFESNYHDSMSFIDDVLGELSIRDMQGDTMRTLGVYTESQDVYYAESAADAVRKLGEKVIEIINRIKEFISNAIGKIRGIGIKHKALGKDFVKIEKENPELAEKIKVSIASGDIDFATMRGISDYYKEIDKIMADIKKNKIDPKSLRGRLEAAKKKLSENQETIKSVAAALGLVVSAVGLVITIRNFTRSENKAKADLNTTINLQTQAKDALQRELDILEKIPVDKRPATKIGYYATVAAEIERTGGVELSKRMKFVEKVGTKFDNAVKSVLAKMGKTSSYSEKKKTQLQSGINKANRTIKNAEKTMHQVNNSLERGASTVSHYTTALNNKKTRGDISLNEKKLIGEDQRQQHAEEKHVLEKEKLQKEIALAEERRLESKVKKDATISQAKSNKVNAEFHRRKTQAETEHINAKTATEATVQGLNKAKASREKISADATKSKAKSDKITQRHYQDKLDSDRYASLMHGDKAAADADYTRKKMEHFGEKYDSNYEKRRAPYRDKKNGN